LIFFVGLDDFLRENGEKLCWKGGGLVGTSDVARPLSKLQDQDHLFFQDKAKTGQIKPRPLFSKPSHF